MAVSLCAAAATLARRSLPTAAAAASSTLPAHLSATAGGRRPLSAAAGPAVPAALVKQLREMTGAPMMDCRNALAAEGNDVSKAVDWLRKKGMAAASKKAGRAAAQGLVAAAVSETGDSAVLLELNSETDFVARNEQFQALAGRLARTALATLPGGAPAAGAPTGVAPVDDASFAAWRDATPLPGGDSLGAPTTVGGSIVDLVARIRENIIARRAVRLGVPGGLVAAYTHNAVAPGLGTIGVLVGLAPADAGKSGGALPPAGTPAHAALVDIARKVAMHVAAARPLYASRDGVPSEALEREKAILTEQAAASGKPAAIVAKMVDGRLAKFYGETVLPEQPYVLSEDGAKVAKWVDAAAKAAGAPPVRVVAFAHFVVGEGVAPAAAEE